MPLVPEYQAMLRELAAAEGPPLSELSPAEGRELYRLMRPLDPDIPVGDVRDRSIAGPAGDLSVRIYTPSGPGPFPVLVNFHGGGWVIGDLDTADAVCRDLCAGAGCVVVSVDYRLAPEAPYPAAVEDAFASTRWAAANMTELNGNGRLAVAGESAGGNLAAAVALRARDQGGPAIVFQLLAYPVTDCDLGRASYAENGQGYLLETDTMRWFWDHYCPPELRREPDAAPLHAADLGGLPPALVLTAEFDPLRDEGEAYAAALQSAGTPARCQRFDGLPHDFLATARSIPASAAAFEQVCAALRDAFGR